VAGVRRSVTQHDDPAFDRVYSRQEASVADVERVAGTRLVFEEGFVELKARWGGSGRDTKLGGLVSACDALLGGARLIRDDAGSGRKEG
jgi:hypothetical protein